MLEIQLTKFWKDQKMKMKNLMHFEVKTHKGKHRNLLAESVVNFLNQEHYSVSLGKNVKYADMDLTQFINTIAKAQKELDRLKLNIERSEAC